MRAVSMSTRECVTKRILAIDWSNICAAASRFGVPHAMAVLVNVSMSPSEVSRKTIVK